MIQCGGEAREFQQGHVDRLYQRLTALETKNQQLEARMEYLLTNDVAKKNKLPDSVVVTGNRTTFNIEQIRHTRGTSTGKLQTPFDRTWFLVGPLECYFRSNRARAG